MSKRQKFGEILVEAGVINDIALRQALERQRITGWRLGKVLESMGVIAEKDIAVALSRQYGFRSAKDFARHTFPPELLCLLDTKLAKKYCIFPLKREGNSLYLAMTNPLDIPLIDEISAATRLHIIPVVTTSNEITLAIKYQYDGQKITDKTVSMVGEEPASLLIVDSIPSSRLKIVEFLKGSGYLVEHTANDKETIAEVHKKAPHLIVIDTEYPDQVNPLSLLESLGDIPLIAVGPNPIKEEVAFLDAGFVDFIHKPFHQERLLSRIRSTLRLVYGEPMGTRRKPGNRSK